MIRLQTLGELRLHGADGVVAAGRRKDLVLLAYLARHAPRGLSREVLAELLWGGRSDERARHSLRQALVQLRRVVGDGLRVDPDRVALTEGALDLDASAFETELAAGRLAEAVACWKGEFLEGADDLGGDRFRAWLEAERERLLRQLAWALERLTAEAERRGQWAAAATWAEHWARVTPADEHAHLHWCEALRRDGRTAEALATHAAFLARLRQDPETAIPAALEELSESLERAARSEQARVGSVAVFTPDLVGRDAALRELDAAWQHAHGAAAVLVVEGEEGIGKTRLCEEFLGALAARSEPALVLRTRAVGNGGSARWTVAREWLAPLREAPGLSAAPDAALADLSRLVPSLRERYLHLPTPAPAAGDRALPSAVACVLAEVAAEVPLVLFLDDFQAADPATQELVLALARQPVAGVLLLLTARADEARVATLLAELHGTRGVRRLLLPPLGAAEVAALLASMLDLSLAERMALAHRLHAETGGNPFYVRELVSALVDDGWLTPDERGEWRLAPELTEGPLPLPSGVQAAVAHRLRHLSEPARWLIAVAAALPSVFRKAALRATAELPDPVFGDALGELIARRLVREAPAEAGSFEFAHPVIRRVAATLDRPPARSWRRSWPRRAALATLAAAGVVGVGAALLAVRRSAPLPAEGVIAVGTITEPMGWDSAGIARALPDMLATNLARVPGLRVVSNARMHEMLAQLGAGPDVAALLPRAARHAGASELIEGTLYRAAGGGLRLDLRRIELRSGTVRHTYAVEAADPFALVDQATARFTSGATTPHGPRLAEATTSSFVAYRFYVEGVRAYYQGDAHAARRLFGTALAEDTAFAMAAYYLARTLELAGDTASNQMLLRAARLADRATDRERLLIHSARADWMEEPASLALAETLAIRYPMEPHGHYLLGLGKVVRADFAGALPHLRRVIEMDSLGLRGTHPLCRACDAYFELTRAHTYADSFAAAERVAREWTRHQTGSARAWNSLATLLEYQDRYDEARAARRRAAPLQPGHRMLGIWPALIDLRAGDFEQADAALRDRLRDSPPAERAEALWFLAISLRYQGRLREALEVARRLRPPPAARTASAPPSYEAALEAQILFEMGRFHEAAALFDSIADLFQPGDPLHRRGRDRTAWLLGHRATALAAAGDTAALLRLADTIEVLGRQTALARDARLHYHVRGLLHAARAEAPAAIDRFRHALYSLGGGGYTRTNYELARLYLELDRPRDAIAILQPALRGPFESANLYLSRTELHALLGRAHEAAGERDRAAAHYRHVLHAWQHADPQFHARRDSVRMRLELLDGGGKRR
jgi:DNA-binding SARP family transcriptional activator/tetratricopeptide (TPR) repeat protein/TolB-like protein